MPPHIHLRVVGHAIVVYHCSTLAVQLCECPFTDFPISILRMPCRVWRGHWGVLHATPYYFANCIAINVAVSGPSHGSILPLKEISYGHISAHRVELFPYPILLTCREDWARFIQSCAFPKQSHEVGVTDLTFDDLIFLAQFRQTTVSCRRARMWPPPRRPWPRWAGPPSAAGQDTQRNEGSPTASCARK